MLEDSDVPLLDDPALLAIDGPRELFVRPEADMPRMLERDELAFRILSEDGTQHI